MSGTTLLTQAVPLDVRTLPDEPTEDKPVPPRFVPKEVVRPVRLVMSELAPEAAAPMLDRAVAAVVPAVPPLANGNGELYVAIVPRPRLVLAPEAMVAPVPPLPIATVPVTLTALPEILPDILEPAMVLAGSAVGGPLVGAMKAKTALRAIKPIKAKLQ